MKKQFGIMIMVVMVLLLSMLTGCGGEDRITDHNPSDEIHESDGTSELPVTSVQTEEQSNDQVTINNQEHTNDQESMWGELPPVPLS